MTTEATPGAADLKATPPADEGKKGGEGAPGAGEQKPDAGKPAEGGDKKPDAKSTSLFDTDGGEKPAEAKKPDEKKDEKPLDPNDPDAWLLAEGVMGTGPRPEWLLKDKYANVLEQAKAYPELQKRFGSFTGAPKDGKYTVPAMPEGVEGEFLTDHPVFSEFTKWAGENQLSQKGYDSLLGLLAQYEQSQVPDMAAIKQSLGEKADERIGAVASWAKANLTSEQFAMFREVGATAAAGQVLQIMEAVIAKVQAAKTPPKVGDDTAAAAPVDPLEAIRKEHAKRGPDGKLLFDTDPKHRAAVEKAYAEYFNKQKS